MRRIYLLKTGEHHSIVGNQISSCNDLTVSIIPDRMDEASLPIHASSRKSCIVLVASLKIFGIPAVATPFLPSPYHSARTEYADLQ